MGRANRRSYARLPAGSWHPLLAQSCQPGRGRLLVGVLSTPTRGHQGAGGGTGGPIRLGRSRAFLGRGEGRRARPRAPGTFAPSSSPRARCCPSSYTRLDRSLLCHKKDNHPCYRARKVFQKHCCSSLIGSASHTARRHRSRHIWMFREHLTTENKTWLLSQLLRFFLFFSISLFSFVSCSPSLPARSAGALPGSARGSALR